MARYRGAMVKRFLDVLWKEAKGSSIRAAEIAGYKDPASAGPRLRQRFQDLAEQARLAWAESAHVSYDEALNLLGQVARNTEHREQVRAIALILDLHGARAAQDPAQLRREVTGLLKQLQIQRGLPAATNAEILEAETTTSPTTGGVAS